MIDRLVKLAKEEMIPEVDVSQAVMNRIHRIEEKRTLSLKPMGWMAAVSAVAASIIFFFSLQVNRQLHDPFDYFFAPISITSIEDMYYLSTDQ